MSKNLIAISAPSGTGKTTLCRSLQKLDASLNFSVSCTTRPKRKYEKEGFDYSFISQEDFKNKISLHEFIEFEEVHGYLYGTLKSSLDDAIKHNQLLLLEVDVRGAMTIKALYPEHSLSVFILPPSLGDLRKRLESRGTDSEERIQKRLERLELEMGYKERFDFSIINDEIEIATIELHQLINKVSKGEINGT